VSQLSTRMGLAHNTVSGIAARLERHGLLSRTAQPDDRRYTRLELTEPVRDWLDRDLPAARLGPLVDAMRNATDEERSAILDGLAALRLAAGQCIRSCQDCSVMSTSKWAAARRMFSKASARSASVTSCTRSKRLSASRT